MKIADFIRINDSARTLYHVYRGDKLVDVIEKDYLTQNPKLIPEATRRLNYLMDTTDMLSVSVFGIMNLRNRSGYTLTSKSAPTTIRTGCEEGRVMEQREKLIKMLVTASNLSNIWKMADFLLANGVVVLPCRCVECEYRNEYECEKMYDHLNECQGIKTDIDLDWYCADAKRKGGDE